LAPSETAYRELRANAFFQLGEAERAAGDIELLLKLKPDAKVDPMVLMAFGDRARARMERGDMIGAVTDFEIAVKVNPEIEQDPQFANALLARCDLMLSQHKNELALADLEKALRINPELVVQPHLGSVYCARAQGRLQRGKTDQRALELDPNLADAYAVRGNVHKERMDYADALADLEKAVQLDPSRSGELQPEIQKIRGMLG
jgi:tetratricopeptide (TPR) repeat protein